MEETVVDAALAVEEIASIGGGQVARHMHPMAVWLREGGEAGGGLIARDGLGPKERAVCAVTPLEMGRGFLSPGEVDFGGAEVDGFGFIHGGCDGPSLSAIC